MCSTIVVEGFWAKKNPDSGKKSLIRKILWSAPAVHEAFSLRKIWSTAALYEAWSKRITCFFAQILGKKNPGSDRRGGGRFFWFLHRIFWQTEEKPQVNNFYYWLRIFRWTGGKDKTKTEKDCVSPAVTLPHSNVQYHRRWNFRAKKILIQEINLWSGTFYEAHLRYMKHFSYGKYEVLLRCMKRDPNGSHVFLP